MDNIYPEFLSKGIERLEAFYKKKLKDEQKAEILEAIHPVCDLQKLFIEAISSLIETGKYFPTIRDIKNAYMNIKNRAVDSGRITLKQYSDCLLCNGRGVVTVLKNGVEYAMACKCKAGDGVNLPRHKLEPLKYDPDFELSPCQDMIYKNLVRGKKIEELCPF